MSILYIYIVYVLCMSSEVREKHIRQQKEKKKKNRDEEEEDEKENVLCAVVLRYAACGNMLYAIDVNVS